MGKEIKLQTEEQKHERNMMAGRILPKRDFKKVLEHDKIYANTLSHWLEFMTIKQDILSKKCEKHLNPTTQTRDGIIDNIDMLCEFGETRVSCLDITAKVRIQNKLVEDKINHYENVFMPQYKKEVKEMNEGFDKYMKRAEDLIAVKDVPYLHHEITEKTKLELDWWNHLKSSQRKEDEYKLLIFKPLKRLINALDGLEENK